MNEEAAEKVTSEAGSMWLLALSLGNAILYGAGAILIGGAAPFGKVDGPRYFVGDHGRLIEVTQSVYWYSWVHSLSMLVTVPLMIVAAIRIRRAQDRGSLP
jgi:hypothetical protein